MTTTQHSNAVEARIDAARRRKAHLLADALDAADVSIEALDEALHDDAWWAQLAEAVGVNPPSVVSRRLTISIIEGRRLERDCGPADPFDGVNGR
jgi:hypothetical protein